MSQPLPTRILVLVLAGALLAAGCRGRQAAPAQSPAETRESSVTRVGVVDLNAVARAHPRWSELDTLSTKIRRVEVDVATTPLPPPPPAPDLRPALDAEAKRLRAEFEQELQAMRDVRRRQLESHAASLREEQQTKFATLRKQLEDEGRQALEAKRVELETSLRASELGIMEEYKYPLLNLRLRAEVAGLSSEQEGREVLAQIQALQQEREERLRVKNEEIGDVFEEFQKAKEAEINARLKAAQEVLTREAQEQLQARERQMESDLNAAAARRDRDFKTRLEARRRALIRAAERQLGGRQGTFLRDLASRTQQLRAQLAALQEQRARLEDSILAEVKIEVATIAQEERLDVVLTRLLGNVGGIDITAKVVEKLKR